LSFSSCLLNFIEKNFVHKSIRCTKNVCIIENWKTDSCKNFKTKPQCFTCQMFVLFDIKHYSNNHHVVTVVSNLKVEFNYWKPFQLFSEWELNWSFRFDMYDGLKSKTFFRYMIGTTGTL
jgi:hypothetical protein